MRQTRMTRRHDSSSTESDYMEHDPHIVSLLLLADPGTKTSIQSSYQGMINMLDNRLQVICTTDKDIVACSSYNNVKKEKSSSDAIPSLAIVLFFNPGSRETLKYGLERRQHNSFSRPDLLQNHIFNHSSGTKNCHRKQNSRICEDGRLTPKNKNFTVTENDNDRERESPFLRYDIILQESREREKQELYSKEHDEALSKSFDLESSVATLEVRKQLQTWPWEFHHRAATTKGITQCQSNSQDFYVYHPDQEVTRLYGDVIDTSKISRKMNILGVKEKVFDEMLDNTLHANNKFHSTHNGVTTGTTEYPLMAVREVHYGRQHLRYMMFVSDTTWTNQVEFYRLLLRRHVVTLREDFCFFTVFSGEDTDVQFALKKLTNKQSSICLGSTVLQFKIQNVGHLVPLLPHSCQPINETKWRTHDHDGNMIILDIAENNHVADEPISNCHRKHHSLDVSRASHSDIDSNKMSSEEEVTLERLDSFVEPELPDRMPLLKPYLYTNLGRKDRFNSRTTSGSSQCSSSSNSPERKPLKFRFTPRIQKMFPDRSSPAICSNLPQPHRASTPVRFPARSHRSGSLFSESSDEPENTNFYRKAKMQNDRSLTNKLIKQQVQDNQSSKQRYHKRRSPNPPVYQNEQQDELEFYV